jgi:hypothetical protein
VVYLANSQVPRRIAANSSLPSGLCAQFTSGSLGSTRTASLQSRLVPVEWMDATWVVHGNTENCSITETPAPRAATSSTKPVPRVLRPKPRCGSASWIIRATTSHDIREPACSDRLTCTAGTSHHQRQARFEALSRILRGQHPQFAHTADLLRQLILQPDYRRLGSGFKRIFDSGSSLVKIDLSSS